MYILNSAAFYDGLRRAGYRSLSELARKVGVHRNSLSAYLNGKEILPSVVEASLRELNLEPSEILKEKKQKLLRYDDAFGRLADELHDRHPEVSYFLFGSRAKKRNKKYSDYDIGIYSQKGIDFNRYLEIVETKEELAEDFCCFVDLVNLNYAEQDFMTCIASDIKPLAGKQSDFFALMEKIGHGFEEY